MIRIKSYISIVLLLLLLSSCGYRPVLIENSYNFSIKFYESSGDKNINTKIKDKLSKLSGINRTFEISLNSSVTKNIVSKDTEGNPSILEIVINLNYKLMENRKVLIHRTLKQRSNYNNISDKFELKKSEQILIDNLVDNLISDIIFSASNLITNPMNNDN